MSLKKMKRMRRKMKMMMMRRKDNVEFPCTAKTHFETLIPIHANLTDIFKCGSIEIFSQVLNFLLCLHRSSPFNSKKLEGRITDATAIW